MKQILSKADSRRMIVRFEEMYPDAGGTLRFATPFQLLVATMLAAQSTADRVNEVTARLFAKYPGPADFAGLTPDELHADIQELGIFRGKSDHIIGTAKMILNWYRGEVPTSQEALVKLPGVGRKTANRVIADGLGIPALAVDTNVQRVANRIGLANSMNPEITEKQLCQRIPRHLWGKTHHMLYRHGRETCTSRNPKCDACGIAALCPFRALLASDGKLREKVFQSPDGAGRPAGLSLPTADGQVRDA